MRVCSHLGRAFARRRAQLRSRAWYDDCVRIFALAALLLALIVPAAAAQGLTTVGEPANGGGVFRFPQAVAYSPGGGSVIVGDEYSGRVSIFGPNGSFRTWFGGRAVGRETARFGVIGGVATDSAGRIYVLDSENERFQVFDAAGNFLNSFGDAGVFTLFGAQDAELGAGISVGGIAVGPGPVVYVADAGADRVVRVPYDPGTNTFGAATATGPIFAAPQGLAIDPSGSRLFVADDDNHRIAVLDPATLGELAIFGSHGTGLGELNFPYDVAIDATGRLYVADNENNRIDVFDASTFAPLGAFGSGGRGVPGQFAIVRSVGALSDNPNGGVVAADTANDRVQTLNTAGAVTSAWGVSGRGPGYVTRPRGVAFAPDGSIAVADTFDDRIERFGADGAYAGQFGVVSQSTGFTIPGNAPGQYDGPSGVAYDRLGQLWIADSRNNRVVELATNGVVLFTTPVGALSDPRAIVRARNGDDMLVADRGHNRIARISRTGVVTDEITGLNRPVAVADDGTDIYAADADGVWMDAARTPVVPPSGGWDTPEGLASRDDMLFVAQHGGIFRRVGPTWDDAPLVGQGSGDGQVTEARGMTFNGTGTLLIADSGNNRVLRLDPGAGPAPLPQLSVSMGPITLGRVTSSPDGIQCATDCLQHYSAGSLVTLTATPVKGYVLTGWSGACSGTAPACVVRMNGSQSVGATFGVAPPTPPPAPVATPTPVPPRRVTPPVKVSALRMSSRTLRKQVTVSLTLSRPATLTVTTQAARAGRRSGSRCVKPTARLRRRARCTYYVALAGQRTVRGSGTVRFTLKRGKLKPGGYRLAIIALDTSGNRVGPSTIAFDVRR